MGLPESCARRHHRWVSETELFFDEDRQGPTQPMPLQSRGLHDVEEARWRDIDPDPNEAPAPGRAAHSRPAEPPRRVPRAARRRWWCALAALLAAVVLAAVSFGFVTWDEPACGGRLYVPSGPNDTSCIDPAVLAR